MLLNSFKLFQLAKKLLFFAYFLSFFSSVALLCNSKKPLTEQKTPNFRFNSKSLNEFTNKYNTLSFIWLFFRQTTDKVNNSFGIARFVIVPTYYFNHVAYNRSHICIENTRMCIANNIDGYNGVFGIF